MPGTYPGKDLSQLSVGKSGVREKTRRIRRIARHASFFVASGRFGRRLGLSPALCQNCGGGTALLISIGFNDKRAYAVQDTG